jgi:hypothetical protein
LSIQARGTRRVKVKLALAVELRRQLVRVPAGPAPSPGPRRSRGRAACATRPAEPGPTPGAIASTSISTSTSMRLIGVGLQTPSFLLLEEAWLLFRPLFVLADEATWRVWPITSSAGGDVPPSYGVSMRRDQPCSLPYWLPPALRSKPLTW